MFNTFSVNGFRQFASLKMAGLERVNLLVGRNNSGKSSVLEAISIFVDPPTLIDLSLRRGEIIFTEEDEGRDLNSPAREELDISCLFNGYPEPSTEGAAITIVAGGSWAGELLIWKEMGSVPGLGLRIDDGPEGFVPLTEQYALPLWEERRLVPGVVRRARHKFPRHIGEPRPVVFIEPNGYSAAKLAGFVGSILLTPEEDYLLDCLRLIEPTVQRVAVLPDALRSRTVSQKQGIVVLCEGRKRLPLGNLGDGVWRLLTIALSLINARDGVLLVDEIDSGLHYTVLEGLWRLVLKTASRLNVQVFATTHSDDCWKALGRVLESEGGRLDQSVSLQRLEARKDRAILFPGNRIRIAAANEIEVR